LAYASGMAAITGLLESLPNGARVLIPEDCYTGLRYLAHEFLPERGIHAVAVDMADLPAVDAACAEPVAMIWAETPSNPRLKVCDIAALAEIAQRRGALLACDNTFATPVLQRPLALGADVVMHSTTKYFGGHSDVLGGALVFAQRDDLYTRVAHRRHITGAVLAPFSAWLTLRGCRSLPARMALHCANARRLADFLAAHPAVDRVNFPGLATHPGHAIAVRQMTDYGAMLSIEVRGGREAALRVAGKLRLFTNATSLGGCESLVEHRASVEGGHPISPQDLLRISVGLEHVDDLIADWAQALS
jgi:cystathionine gamma-synthase